MAGFLAFNHLACKLNDVTAACICVPCAQKYSWQLLFAHSSSCTQQLTAPRQWRKQPQEVWCAKLVCTPLTGYITSRSQLLRRSSDINQLKISSKKVNFNFEFKTSRTMAESTTAAVTTTVTCTCGKQRNSSQSIFS